MASTMLSVAVRFGHWRRSSAIHAEKVFRRRCHVGNVCDHNQEQQAERSQRELRNYACVQLALENRFDPVVDYLNGLKWDGIGRIDAWLTTYCGAVDTELNRAIGRIALVALVRRARQPGCKFDQIIVLESPEGYFKSTALSILAGPGQGYRH